MNKKAIIAMSGVVDSSRLKRRSYCTVKEAAVIIAAASFMKGITILIDKNKKRYICTPKRLADEQTAIIETIVITQYVFEFCLLTFGIFCTVLILSAVFGYYPDTVFNSACRISTYYNN